MLSYQDQRYEEEGVVLHYPPYHPKPRQTLRTIIDILCIDKTSMVPAMAGRQLLSKQDGSTTPKEEKEMRDILRHEAVRAITWAATMTRPIISSPVRTVVKFCENPGKKP